MAVKSLFQLPTGERSQLGVPEVPLELKFQTDDTKQVFVGIIDSAKRVLAARDALAQHEDLTN